MAEARRVTAKQLIRRIPKARHESAKSFVIRLIAGKRDPNTIDITDRLSVFGIDDRNIDALGKRDKSSEFS